MPDDPTFNLDEAISADLDDELAPFAVELGVDIATLRALMAERPEYAERRAALETASRSLRAPVDSLDDVARARLLRAAMTTEPRTSATSASPVRRERAWRLLGAAAAVVLVVVGGIALLRGGGSSGGAKSASTAGNTAKVRSGELGNLGPLDPSTLDSLIGGDTRADSTPTAPKEESSTLSGGTDAQRSAASEQPSVAADAAASVTPAQVDACRTEYAKVGTVRFSGTGDYTGRPAVVLGVETGGRTIVFVVAATDCSEVLVSVSR
ncbi:MAG: hypothetical protein ABIP21_09920 [Acidimicrobiia bacterium]